MNRMNEIQQRDQDELSRFRRGIDLGAFVSSFGYELDKKDSNTRTKTYRRESDKIIVSKGKCGFDIFKDCRSEAHGSVIDFAQMETGEDLGRTRQRLRAWMGHGNPKDFLPTCPSVQPPTDAPTDTDEPDRKKCSSVWNAATWNPEPAYLLSRGLTAESLADERFRDTFRVNPKGAVMFLHKDRIGPTGYELRGIKADGSKLKAFMADGKRGLWFSNNLREAKSVVICESAIDCLSHYQLYGWDTAYVSIGGAISLKQKELLAGLFAKFTAKNGLMIVGTDNDAAGDNYFTTMETLTPTKLKRHCSVGNDWNADLTYVRNEA